ncbi:MAG: outer membrane beta-barrel protein [Bacteroidales bacterium]
MKPLKYIFLSIIIIVCFSHFSEAQEGNARISGVILNPDNHPAMYSTVILLNEDSILIKGAFSQEDGSFVIEKIAPGKYFVFIRNIEFKHWISDTLKLNKDENMVMDTIHLEYGTSELQEVVITAERPFAEMKVDRMVINVGNVTNAGSNALEVLERSPGIIINRFTKTISMFGKEGVIVMINGKISRMSSDAVVDMLEGMNVANVESIELIHTPPAKFEAEGNAGIINIVLKSNPSDGLNGTYSINGGRGLDNKYGGGVNLNYRKGMMNIYGGYDYNYDLNPQVFTNYRGVNQGFDFLETETFSDRPYTPTTVQNARIGVDLQLSENTVLGVLGSFFDRHWYMEAVNTTTVSRNGMIETSLRMPNSETNHNRSVSGNINLNQKFLENHTINMDADFIRYEMNNPSNYGINQADNSGKFIPQYNLRIGKKIPINIGVLTLDYTYNASDKIILEAGAKYTLMGFDNDFKVDSLPFGGAWMEMPGYTSESYLDENILGSYISLSVSPNNKTDIKAGLRYEYTNSNLGSVVQPDIVDRHYGSWFPSFFITRRISDSQNLNFSYSRRITRPQISQLAPFYIFTDPYTVLTGNSALQPAIVDAARLDYGFKTWRIAVSYGSEKGSMSWVPVIDPERNQQVNTIHNMNYSRVLNLNLYMPLKITSWWEVINNVFANNTLTSLTLEENDIQTRGNNYGFNSSSTFKLLEGFILELTGNYNSPRNWGVISWNATGDIHFGVQKELSSNWGKLRFNVSNILQTGNWHGTTRQPDNNLMVDLSFRFSERVFMLAWSNTFGSDKVKAARSRKTGASEERQRL